MKRISGGQKPTSALGERLRAARTDRGLTQRDLAELLQGTGIDQSKISRTESGNRPADAAEIAAILNALEITGEEADELLELTAASSTDPYAWTTVGAPFESARLPALLDYEQRASGIREISPNGIPGLLQTSKTARAIMRAARTASEDIETRVAIRVGRREIIMRDNDPVQYTAYIGEQALHAEIGGPEVRVAQLEHLLFMIRTRKNIEVRIVPMNADWNPSHDGPAMILEINESTTVVVLENRLSGLFLRGEEVVAAYKQAADDVHRASLSPTHSIELIELVLKQARKE